LVRAEEPILWPEASWERFGQVPNVTFAEGLVIRDNAWYLYYWTLDNQKRPISNEPVDACLD